MSGKGSARRPRFVPLADLEAQWERTFGPVGGAVAAVGCTDYVAVPRESAQHAADLAIFNAVAGPIERMQLEAYCATPLPSAPDGEATRD